MDKLIRDDSIPTPNILGPILSAGTLTAVSTALYLAVKGNSEKLSNVVRSQQRAIVGMISRAESGFTFGYMQELVNLLYPLSFPRVRTETARYRFQRKLKERLGSYAGEQLPTIGKEAIEDLNRRIASIYTGLSPAEVAGKLIEPNYSIVLSRIERDYPGLTALITTTMSKGQLRSESKISIHYEGVKEVIHPRGAEYVIPIVEELYSGGEFVGKRVREVRIPSLRYGTVFINGSVFAPVAKGFLKGDKIIVKMPGELVVDDLKKRFQTLRFGDPAQSFADRMVTTIRNTTSFVLGKESAANLNSMATAISLGVELDAIKIVDGRVEVPYIDKYQSIRSIISNIHNAPVFRETYNDKGTIDLTEFGTYYLKHSSDASITKGKLRLVGQYSPIDPYNMPIKPSSFRMRPATGPYTGIPLSKVELAKTLGPIDRYKLESLSKAQIRESIPGKMANIALFLAEEKLPQIGPGNVVALYHTFGNDISTNKLTSVRETIYAVKNLGDIPKRIRQGNVTVNAGDIIGYDSNNKPIRAERSGSITNLSVEGDQYKIKVDEKVPFGVGIKLASDKTVVSVIKTANEYASLVDEYGTKIVNALKRVNPAYASILSTRYAAYASYIRSGQNYGNVVDFIVGKEIATKRYFGENRVGEGIVLKVLQDAAWLKHKQLQLQLARGRIGQKELESKLKEFSKVLHSFTESAFGSEIANAYENIEVTQDGVIAIIRKPRGSYDETAFVQKVFELESILKEATEGKTERLFTLVETIKKYAKANRIPKMNLVGEVGHYARMNNPRGLERRGMANFLVERSKNASRLVAAMINASVMVHSAAVTPTYSVASDTRALNGFVGGAHIILDNIRNAEIMGLRHHVGWFMRLLDYAYPYLEDKSIAGMSRVLSVAEKEVAQKQGIIVGGMKKNIHVITADMLFSHNNLGHRLAANFMNQTAIIGAANRMNIVKESLDADIAKELELEGFNTLEQLLEQGKLGLTRNSLSLVDEETMHELIKLVNSAPKNSVIYLELPDEVNVEGVTGVKYVPISRYAVEDAFAFDVVVDKLQRTRERYYTGSEIHNAQTSLFMAVCDKAKEIKWGSKVSKAEDAEISAMEAKVQYYLRTLRSIGGKAHPFTKRLTKISAPLSAKAAIAELSSLGIGEVGIHENMFISIITQGKYKSYKEISEAIERLKAVEAYYEKNIPTLRSIHNLLETEVFPANNAKEITKVTKQMKDLGIVPDAQRRAQAILRRTTMAIGKDLKEAPEYLIEEVRKKLGVKGTTGLPDSRNLTIKNAREIASIFNEFYTKRGKREVATLREAERYLKLVRRVKSGELRVFGSLQGFPALSELSGTHARVRVLSHERLAKEIGSAFMEKSGGVDRIDKLIYLHPATAVAAARDFDGDTAALFVNAFHTLEKVYEKERYLSWLSKVGLTRNGVRGLVEESIARSAVDRLVVRESREKGLLKVRPASLSSSYMMKAIEEEARNEMFYLVSVSDYIADMLKSSGIEYTEKDSKKAVKRIFNLIGGSATEDLKNVSVLVSKGTVSDELIKKASRTNNVFSVIKDNIVDIEPARTMSDMAQKLRDEVVKQTKEEFKEYFKLASKNAAERYADIKALTPQAYNTHNAVLAVIPFFQSQKSGKEASDTRALKARFTAFADKIIAQNTISSKHGNPNVIADIESTLRSLAKHRESGETPEEALKKLATGNYVVNVGDSERNMIRALGFETENIDYATFDEYLRTRENLATIIQDAHRQASEKLKDRITESGIVSEYKAEVRKIIQNYEIKAPSSVHLGKTLGKLSEKDLSTITQEWSVLSPQVADLFVEDAKNRVKVSTKFALDYIEALHGPAIRLSASRVLKSVPPEKVGEYAGVLRNVHERLSHRTNIGQHFAAAAMLYHGTDGTDIFTRGTEEILRRRKKKYGYEENILPDLTEATITLVTDEEMKNMSRSSLADRLLFRLATYMTKRKDVTINTPSQNSLKERIEETLRYAERNERVRVQQKMKFEYTPFNPLIEQAKRAVEGEVFDEAIGRAVNHSRNVSLAIGALIGITVGQTILKAVTGYAVPELRETQGGGEYYDRVIIGKSPELFREQRPVRVAPWSDIEYAGFRELDFIEQNASAFIAAGNRRATEPRPQLKNPYKGVTIR